MRLVTGLLLIIFLCISIAAYPQTPSFKCASAKILIAHHIRSGYAWVATAVERQGFAASVFVNLRTGRWSVVGIDGDFQGCVLLEGNDWQFALERGA